MLRQIEEIMAWYSEICFVEGKANTVADWLSRYFVVEVSYAKAVFQKVGIQELSLQARILDLTGDEHLRLVENFSRLRQLSLQLDRDERVAVKRSSNRFVIRENRLCKLVAGKALRLVWTAVCLEILDKVQAEYTHNGAQKLL